MLGLRNLLPILVLVVIHATPNEAQASLCASASNSCQAAAISNYDSCLAPSQAACVTTRTRDGASCSATFNACPFDQAACFTALLACRGTADNVANSCMAAIRDPNTPCYAQQRTDNAACASTFTTCLSGSAACANVNADCISGYTTVYNCCIAASSGGSTTVCDQQKALSTQKCAAAYAATLNTCNDQACCDAQFQVSTGVSKSEAIAYESTCGVASNQFVVRNREKKRSWKRSSLQTPLENALEDFLVFYIGEKATGWKTEPVVQQFLGDVRAIKL